MTKVTPRMIVEPFFPKDISFLKSVLPSPVMRISYIQQVISSPVGMLEYRKNPAFVIRNLTDPRFNPCMTPNFLGKRVASKYLRILAFLAEEMESGIGCPRGGGQQESWIKAGCCIGRAMDKDTNTLPLEYSR
jgi:hypothetical protein